MNMVIERERFESLFCRDALHASGIWIADFGMVSRDALQCVSTLELLNCHKVNYVIVGARAVTAHSRPRSTGDMDILIESPYENEKASD